MMDVTITIDRALGFTTNISVPTGSTLLAVKEQLSASDPTGSTKVSEFSLAASPKAPGEEPKPLPDGTPLGPELLELDLCQCPPPSVPSPAPEPVALGPPKAEYGGCLWDVVGGADKGGIMVREGRDLKSPPLDGRLATGAIVEELQLLGERLHYKIVRGSGPDEGWVSLKLGLKELLVPHGQTVNKPKDEPEKPDTWEPPSESREEGGDRILAAKGRPHEVLGLEPGASSASTRRAYHWSALKHHPDKGGDATVFKAIADAYKALTEAKDEAGGWRDLEQQAVGPWPGHSAATKGVTCILFDCFGAPPWESRRVYTGSWQEACVRCWELSKGDPGKVRPPPRLVGELMVGGFINDIAAISPFGMLTAQSGGYIPQPGDSMRGWDLRRTPFKAIPASQKAEMMKNLAAQGSADAIEVGEKGQEETALATLKVGESMAVRAEDQQKTIDTSICKVPVMDSSMHDMSQPIFLHYRGCRAISLWPRPESKDSIPVLAGTVSKDMLAVSKIDTDGSTLELPSLWKVNNPHIQTDINALKHENVDRIWSGDNKGIVKGWDVTSGSTEPVSDIQTNFGRMTGMEVWGKPGVLLCSHDDGLGYVDIRAGKVIRSQNTKKACGKVCILNQDDPNLFAGIGPELMQYDTRCFTDGKDAKPKAIGQWTLSGDITALHATPSRKGHLLVAIGCANGSVACFDTS